MVVDYLTAPRGHAPEKDYAIHLITEDELARETTCALDVRGRLLTLTLARVTCRDCRALIAEAK